ncbi:BTAD domain-containing putative transcriptional regulator [Oryzobacter sp. R7]|uniref:BTAD domain-containing putative transcriptional regulator n=1 Tax=Oryzobacter faecalis TaxID=3388656 RepID=UPI00398CCE41
MSVRYTAFGAMAVTVAGARVPLTRGRERGVLAVLLAAKGAPVAAERLVAEVWGTDRAGLSAVQVAVSRLRALLEPDRTTRTGTLLLSTAAGYAVAADTADVDTWAFEDAAVAALAAPDPSTRLALADTALERWTGEPYADTEAPSVRREADRLDELHLGLREDRARALLDLDRPDEALRALADLAPRHPYRERVWALLALAQYRCSRQADALATLRTLREVLADELGVDPTPEVRELEQAVLRQDPSLAARSAAPSAPPGTGRGDQRAGSRGVGRDDVLAGALDVVRSSRATGAAAFLLVAGEPGIGKSRLVADLGAAAADEGAGVVVGRCLEGDYAPALWPWLPVVRELAGATGGAVDPLLAPLLDAGAADGDSGSGTGLRMFDAVVALLSRAAAVRPLVVVLEDVHWADDSSLRLLRHLADAPPAAPLTVVATRRTTETRTGSALVDTLGALARAGAERVRLDGLDDASVRRLLTTSVGEHDEDLDARVARVTGGNPFFVLQYARLLATSPELAAGGPATLPVPDGVRDVLRQRIARLPEGAGRVLTSAAVLGQRVDPELLAGLTDTSVDHCLDVLDLAVAHGLVEERAPAYGFVHALTRETLYAEVSAARRMRLHDRAGRLVEHQRPDDADAVAEIAHHAHVAAPLGREHAARACEWLARAAAVAVARHAHPEALELWQQVLADADGSSATAARAHAGAAAALIRLGRMAEAHAALDTAVAVGSALGDWETVAGAATVLSGSGPWSWREHGVVHAPLVEALTAALPKVDPPLRARLLAILQVEHFYGWNGRLVEDLGRQSVELAREVGDVALLREVMMLRLVASTGSWHRQERLALVEELLGLAPTGELEVTALYYLGLVRWDVGDPAGADEAMARCAAAAAEVRHTGLDIPLAWWRAARARDVGAPGAVELVHEVAERFRGLGYVGSRELACLQAVRGAPVGAPVDDTTVARAEEGGMPLRALVAHALLESGDAERARSLLGPPAPDDVVDYCSTAGRCLRLLVLSSVGAPDEVRAALAPLVDHLGEPVSYGTIDHLGCVDHFVAAGLAALGDPRAAEVAAGAVAANERIGCRPWARRSRELLAALSPVR